MVSPCRFLFNVEAQELYDLSEVSEEFVNQSLATLMKINTIFLSRKENDGFVFIDPAAFNNQCHLYAYLAARLRSGYKTMSEEEKGAQTIENRFLHLAFILSFTFLTDRRLICRVIEGLDIEIPEPKKRFYTFVKDGLPKSQGVLIRTARAALNDVFERIMKGLLDLQSSKSPLDRELSLLAHEELRLVEGGPYTYPKFAGVLFLLRQVIPCVFKTKIVSEDGTAYLEFSTGATTPDTSVLVFNCLASETFSIADIRKYADGCPHCFERKPGSKNRHDEKEICLHCTTKQVDPSAYLARFQRAMSDIPATLQALGADFMLQEQASFKRYFSDSDTYPLLTELFQAACASIETLGLGMKNPSTFTVKHVYVDSYEHAMQPVPRMCMSPEAFLRSRGYL